MSAKKNGRITIVHGNPAISAGPVAFRPCFSAGLVFTSVVTLAT